MGDETIELTEVQAVIDGLSSPTDEQFMQSLRGYSDTGVALAAAKIAMSGVSAAGSDFFNVKDFGAVGDGVTDDSAAILATVNAAAGATNAAQSSRGAVYFPPGIYLVGTSACLTPNAHDHLPGIKYFGAGMFASILRLDPSGSDIYFYDNVATARSTASTFSDLGFEGMDPADFSVYTNISNFAKGFRLWATTATGSHEQGFKFARCRFYHLGTGFELAGDNTTSEISFVQCRFKFIRNTVYSINNLQSFNHTFYGTNIEVVYGDTFSIGSLGGGAIQMFGGSVIPFSDAGADTYFLKSAGTSNVLQTPITFDGVRFEFRGNKANLCSFTSLKRDDVFFNNCLFYTDASADLESFCKVGSYSTLNFLGATWNEGGAGKFKFHCIGTSRYGQSGTITFERSILPVDWSDRCALDDDNGHIRAIDCPGDNIGATTAGVSWAHDFDLHWNEATPGLYTGWAGSGATLKDGGSLTDCWMRLKTAQIKLPASYWPDTVEHTLRLPKNAIIKSLHLRKPPSGADTTSVTFRVGRDDKSGTDHLVLNTDQMKNAHTGDTTNYFYHVGSTDNERTIRLYTDENPSGTIQGGICIVEYY